MGPGAVSQLLRSGKDHEKWFSLRENHDKVCRFGLHQLRNCSGPEHPSLKSENWATHSNVYRQDSTGQNALHWVSTEVLGSYLGHFDQGEPAWTRHFADNP